MKTIKIVLASAALAVTFMSCSDSKKDMAQEKVDSYEAYVDSISNVASNDAAKNWEVIESDYKKMKADADETVLSVKDNTELQKLIDESTVKYEAYKAEVIAENQRMETVNSKMIMRKTLLGNSYSGDDMTFKWINKDNILSVYQNFVDTASENKDSYSREDWDEIKLLYEAIDTRKNTVEKEGLTTADNRKIAGLKLKFAPMYTFNRMGAKSDENAAAKQ
ncbi:hypothetical protein [Algibacter sp.]|uniref:hypothetical protein n=1 Tax=Algibacter sp. TaxID=1872428 RepID=UPI003C739C36